jgi:hypothetical protein
MSQMKPYCFKCGAELDAEAIYCPVCGRLQRSMVVRAVEPGHQAAPPSGQQDHEQPDPSYAAYPEQAAYPERAADGGHPDPWSQELAAPEHQYAAADDPYAGVGPQYPGAPASYEEHDQPNGAVGDPGAEHEHGYGEPGHEGASPQPYGEQAYHYPEPDQQGGYTYAESTHDYAPEQPEPAANDPYAQSDWYGTQPDPQLQGEAHPDERVYAGGSYASQPHAEPGYLEDPWADPPPAAPSPAAPPPPGQPYAAQPYSGSAEEPGYDYRSSGYGGQGSQAGGAYGQAPASRYGGAAAPAYAAPKPSGGRSPLRLLAIAAAALLGLFLVGFAIGQVFTGGSSSSGAGSQQAAAPPLAQGTPAPRPSTSSTTAPTSSPGLAGGTANFVKVGATIPSQCSTKQGCPVAVTLRNSGGSGGGTVSVTLTDDGGSSIATFTGPIPVTDAGQTVQVTGFATGDQLGPYLKSGGVVHVTNVSVTNNG